MPSIWIDSPLRNIRRDVKLWKELPRNLHLGVPQCMKIRQRNIYCLGTVGMLAGISEGFACLKTSLETKTSSAEKSPCMLKTHKDSRENEVQG